MAATCDWQPTAPVEAGFAPDLADRLDGTLRAGRAPNVHGVVVIRHGRLVLERYGAGEDFKWNRSRRREYRRTDRTPVLRAATDRLAPVPG